MTKTNSAPKIPAAVAKASKTPGRTKPDAGRSETFQIRGRARLLLGIDREIPGLDGCEDWVDYKVVFDPTYQLVPSHLELQADEVLLRHAGHHPCLVLKFPGLDFGTPVFGYQNGRLNVGCEGLFDAIAEAFERSRTLVQVNEVIRASRRKR